jgi:hypothetical protein
MDGRRHTNTNQKKAGIAILISDKADPRERSYWGQRGALHDEERISSLRRHNVYEPNNRVLIYTGRNC